MAADIYEATRRSQALYFRSVDDRSVEGVVGVFDANARVLHRGREIAGSADIKDWIEGIFANSPAEVLTKHICSNMLISVSGDVAEATSDVAVFRWDESNGWLMQSVTRHHDRLAPQGNGVWLFSEKRIESIGGRK